MGQVRAPVDLRHRRREVALRHVADREHVEQAVVRARVGADLHPAAEVAAVRDHDVEHPPGAPLVVDRDLEVGRRPAREDRQRRPEVRRLATEHLARRVGALGDRTAHPRARDVREERHVLAPVPRREGRAAQVDRPRRRPAGRPGPHPPARAGSRTSGRSPSPCREGRPRPRARSRGPARPFATSFTEPSPPTTTSSLAPPTAASRASSPRWPRRSLRSAGPSSPAAAARRWSSGQRRPVEPFADAGLTRKTTSGSPESACGSRARGHWPFVERGGRHRRSSASSVI